jgi:Fur family peroxide stress response transcriptional regulator
MINKVGIDTPKPVVKRMTKQRKVIKEILCNTKEHPTAEIIYEEAKKILPDIGLGTVYRNLQVLVEEGSVLELNCDKRYSRYDGNVVPHAHFVCEKCNRVYDLDIDVNDNLISLANDNFSGTINSCKLEFYGVCEHCQDKNVH